MSQKCVINVDLVDVWGQTGRKQFLRTLAWGDEVTVSSQTAARIEIETVYFNEQPDGSILPVKEVGYLEPAKSSGLKTVDLVRASNQNNVLKVNFVDVQQGDGAVVRNGKLDQHSFAHGDIDGGIPLTSLRVDLGTLVDKELDDKVRAAVGGAVECGLLLRVRHG